MKTIVAIANQMKQDLTIAIAAEQIFSPAASDSQLMKCFEIGLAAPAFDFVRHMLLLSEVMALMRLWDEPDTYPVHSIPALTKRLSEESVVAKMAQRERHLLDDTRQMDTTISEGYEKIAFSPARENADAREQYLKQAVNSWIADVKSVKGRPEIASLKKQRNESFAHSAASSKVPNVRPMRYDDVREALRVTIPIVSTGFRLATGIDHDFLTTVSVWKDRQFDMWQIVRCAARGQQFLPAAPTVEDLVREFTEKRASVVTISGSPLSRAQGTDSPVRDIDVEAMQRTVRNAVDQYRSMLEDLGVDPDAALSGHDTKRQ